MIARKLSMAALLVVGGMLLGRVTGLLRELAVAAQLGASREADLVTLAIAIPELLSLIVNGGAISAVLIPEFHRLQQRNIVDADRLVAQFSFVIACMSTLLATFCVVGSSWLATVFAPGFDLTGHAAARGVIQIVLWAVPFCALAAVTSAVLQARQALVFPAFSTLIFNCTLIVGMIAGTKSATALAWVVLLAAIVRWLPQYCSTRLLARQAARASSTTDPVGAFSPVWRCDLLNRGHARRYVQTIAAVGTAICLPHFARAFASNTEGGITMFNFAWKLFELPSGLIVVVLTMVVFPKLSLHAQSAEHATVQSFSERISKYLLVGLVPVTIGLIAAAGLMTNLIFGHGKMRPDQLEFITHLTRITLFALPFTVLTMHAMGVCQAYGNTRFPFWVSVPVLVSFLAIAAVTRPLFGMSGVMTAMAMVQFLQCLALAYGVRKCHGISLFPIPAWRLVCLAGAMAAMSCFGWYVTPAASPWWWQFVAAISLAMIGAGLASLAIPEVARDIVQRCRRKAVEPTDQEMTRASTSLVEVRSRAA